MAVMRIVDMVMGMLKRLMLVQVGMVFGHMQPHAQPHQSAGQAQLPGHGLCKKHDRDQSAHKRGS